MKVLSFFLFSTVLMATIKAEEIPYNSLSLKHIEKGGIGYNTGYTTFETFLSVDPNEWAIIPFLDLRGHIFDNGKWAANAGIGSRFLWNDRIYGVNCYYDYRNTKHLSYNQIGVGIETLGTWFDARINGYFPFGEKISSPYNVQFSSFSGHSIILSEKMEFAMKGLNAEVGFHLGGNCNNWNLYGAIGPYYYIGPIGGNTWGGKVRLKGGYKEYISLELIDSFDPVFHNRFQGQISFSFSFGRKSKKEASRWQKRGALACQISQPPQRNEILVINHKKEYPLAIDPVTGAPYYCVFVNNTSSSLGTYESPYHSFSQVQENSSPNDIIYVFPGDGTTAGMNSGIFLKPNQKLWGSGVSHLLQTPQGIVSIPQQTSALPTITNTNVDTEGNAITLATNNAISGLLIQSAMHNGIYGEDSQNLEVSSCIFTNTTTFPIEAFSSDNVSVSITNNQFLNNINGISLNLNGTSNVLCSDNIFTGQLSESEQPIQIKSANNSITTYIENNNFENNAIGAISFDIRDLTNANISILNNTIKNNKSGSRQVFGSSVVVIPNGVIDHCSIALEGNTFSENEANAFYLSISGAFTTLDTTISENTFFNVESSPIVFSTPVDYFRLIATKNTIVGTSDNGIAIIADGITQIGNIMINNNTLKDIGNNGSGIVVNQDFSILDLEISNNEINNCGVTGIISYAPNGIDFLTLNIADNTINNCQNLGSNAASGLDIEQYTHFVGFVTNNTFSNNADPSVLIGSQLPEPATCLTLTGNNSSTGYTLFNPIDGLFNLSPCNVNTINIGTITTNGTINRVESCSNPTLCPP